MNNDINREGARFTVVCKRCGAKYTVVRNWGGGIRRPDVSQGDDRHNPAKCDCGLRQLEVY